jgi:hypothetical protein
MKALPGIVVVVGRARRESLQFAAFDSGSPSRSRPAIAGVQNRIVARSKDGESQCDGRERVARVWTCHHRNAHGATLTVSEFQVSVVVVAHRLEQQVQPEHQDRQRDQRKQELQDRSEDRQHDPHDSDSEHDFPEHDTDSLVAAIGVPDRFRVSIVTRADAENTA